MTNSEPELRAEPRPAHGAWAAGAVGHGWPARKGRGLIPPIPTFWVDGDAGGRTGVAAWAKARRPKLCLE